MMNDEISPFKALDFIRDNAVKYAQAKANVIYMTEYRKTMKSILMAEAYDAKTQSEKETYAYAHPRYVEHLEALKNAVSECEALRWLMVAAEAKIEVYRTLEATKRVEMRESTL